MVLRLKRFRSSRLHGVAKDFEGAGSLRDPAVRRLGLCIGLLAAGLVFCSPQESESGSPEPGFPESVQLQDSQSSSEIAVVLHGIITEQQRAWNLGDIETFMGAYWKDDQLTFSSGGATTRGYRATLDRYRKRYPDRAAMGILAFEGLETTSLGPTSAYTLGRWKLAKQEAAEGNFTLVWQKIDGEWKIVHDHSSQATSR